MYKQVIIARKDLNMSPGKLAAQVSHASMAFLTSQMRENVVEVLADGYGRCYALPSGGYMSKRMKELNQIARDQGKTEFYIHMLPDGKIEMVDEPLYTIRSFVNLDKAVYDEWINGIFTKTVLEAKNRNRLLKAQTMAEEMGMVEGKDFFLIRDNCLTELEPEEVDENGVGRTLTCIGFAPMDSEVIDQIGKKFQLYR